MFNAKRDILSRLAAECRVERPVPEEYKRADEVGIPMRRIVMCLLVFAAAACIVRPAWAQVLYGSVVGTVQDDSGAPVPPSAPSPQKRNAAANSAFIAAYATVT